MQIDKGLSSQKLPNKHIPMRSYLIAVDVLACQNYISLHQINVIQCVLRSFVRLKATTTGRLINSGQAKPVQKRLTVDD